MRYIVRSKVMDGVVTKSISWEDKKGVVVHRENLGVVSGDALSTSIERSYDTMRSKTDKRRARSDGLFSLGKRGSQPDK